jgi:hypothetical protein
MVEHPGTEVHNHISQPIEFGDRVELGADAVASPTPVEHPEAPAVTIEGNLGGKAQTAAFRQLQKAFLEMVRVEDWFLLSQPVPREQRQHGGAAKRAPEHRHRIFA